MNFIHNIHVLRMKTKFRYIALFMLLAGLATGIHAQSSHTADYISLSAVQDAEGNSLSAIPVDGSSCNLIFSLVGDRDDASRRYTAYNLDIELPFGLEVCHQDGSPLIALPNDFSIYATGISGLSHSVSASILSNGHVRVACFSGRNAHFAKTTGILFQMPVRVSSPFVCPGTQQIRISGQNLTVQENAKKYIPADRSESISLAEGEVSVNLAIPAEVGYSTCVFPFDATVPEGLKAFCCNETAGETLYLQHVVKLKAYTPYILYAKMGYSGTLSGSISTVSYRQNVANGKVRSGYLCGAVTPQAITTGFVLQSLDAGVKFYFTAGESFLIPSGKCWLEIAESQARALSFQIKNNETQINTPHSDLETKAPLFDLRGRRVSHPLPGIYIQGNRKLLK